jgi:plasmid maintenance system killer protein
MKQSSSTYSSSVAGSPGNVPDDLQRVIARQSQHRNDYQTIINVFKRELGHLRAACKQNESDASSGSSFDRLEKNLDNLATIMDDILVTHEIVMKYVTELSASLVHCNHAIRASNADVLLERGRRQEAVDAMKRTLEKADATENELRREREARKADLANMERMITMATNAASDAQRAAMAAEASALSAQADLSETQFLRRYSDYCMHEIGLVKQASPTNRQRKWNKIENKIVQERQDYLFEKRQGISDPLPIHLCGTRFVLRDCEKGCGDGVIADSALQHPVCLGALGTPRP